jgi:hypothetical protein
MPRGITARCAGCRGVRRAGKTVLAQSVPDAEYYDCGLPSVRRDLRDPTYPNGENVLVAADVKRANQRRIGGLTVRVVGLVHLAAFVG